MLHLLAIFLGLLAFSLFAGVILQPVSEAAKWAKGPRQYFLSDLFWLMLLVQYPLGYLAVAVHWQDMLTTAILGGLLLVALVAVWYRAVTALSRIGVDGPLRRGVFIVIVLPAAILGSFFSICLIFVAVTSLAPAESPNRLFRGQRLVWLGLPMLPLVAYAFRRLVFWILAGARSDSPAR